MSLTAQPSAPVAQVGPILGMLTVRNLMPNATVFSKTIGGDMVKVEFKAAGYPGDEQRVPTSLANDIDFVNSLERGIIEVVSGPPGYVEALRFETQNAREARVAEEARHSEMLDRRQERDIVGATCIGPAPQGRTGECGVALIQSASTVSDTPPLCTQHKTLSNEYFLAEAGSRGEGATETTDGVVRREWRRAQAVQTRTL
jgi:hypothetical protein